MAREVKRINDKSSDMIYVSDAVYQKDAPYYSVNRAGILKNINALRLKRGRGFNCNALYCVIKGKGYLKYGGKRFIVKVGQIALLSVNEEYELYGDNKTTFGLCWIEFFGADSIAISKRLLDGHSPIYEGEASGVMDYCIELSSSLEAATPVQISFKLYSILCQLDRQRTILMEKQSNSSVNEELKELVKYIDENLGSPLTLDLLAKKALYNPTYLARKFAKIMGESPAKYILKKRISKARKLLILTDMTLESISDGLGFYDVSHFISRFKEYEEVTPAEFRRQCRGLNMISGS